MTCVELGWRHQMEIFSALLAICAGNSPVTGEFPSQRPKTRSFDVFWINSWVNNHEAGALRRRRAHHHRNAGTNLGRRQFQPKIILCKTRAWLNNYIRLLNVKRLAWLANLCQNVADNHSVACHKEWSNTGVLFSNAVAYIVNCYRMDTFGIYVTA